MTAAAEIVLPTSRFIDEPDPEGRWSYVQEVTLGNAAFYALPLREQIRLTDEAGHQTRPISPKVAAELVPLLREDNFPLR